MSGYVGIDYGMGRTNVDAKTGIRYGVISQHSVTQAWCDSAEPDYGPATCPKCGEEVKACDQHTEAFEGGVAIVSDNVPDYPYYHAHSCADYVCETCRHILDSQDVFGDEPVGWSYEGDGYKLVDCLDTDIMVLESLFYTYAQFCSPCVPGAGNLDNAMEDGAKTYCLGHDWFEDGKAPYPVFSVETGKEVKSEMKHDQTA